MTDRVKTVRRKIKQLFDWVKPMLPVLIVLFTVRSAIADWNDVPSGSMQPTILEGDRIFVNKLAYGLRLPFTLEWLTTWQQPQRGDIVVFMAPHDGTRMVKRVVGLPGDRVELRDNQLRINGLTIDYGPAHSTTASPDGLTRWQKLELLGTVEHEIQLIPSVSARRDFGPTIVPAAAYLLMGDNRDNSYDSRYFGFVAAERIVGRATATAMSFDPASHYLPRWQRFLQPLD